VFAGDQLRIPMIPDVVFRTVVVLLLSTAVAAQQGPRQFSREWYAQFSGPYSQPVDPFRIVGNIYYVGAVNLASYLVTTAEGTS
jgi:hypothetical protein